MAPSPSAGREHPWHLRRITHRHLHDRRNLFDLQLLTSAWALPAAIADPFEHEPTLEDDTWPEDALLRLELEIRALQAKTLAEQLRARPAERDQLAEVSYAAGHESASRRWSHPDPRQGSVAPADKRALLMALYHSPLGGLRGIRAFLVRRALVNEVSVELLQCPHRLAEAKVEGLASFPAALQDELCRQHFQWLRGHLSFLNPAVTPVLARPRGRCVVSW